MNNDWIPKHISILGGANGIENRRLLDGTSQWRHVEYITYPTPVPLSKDQLYRILDQEVGLEQYISDNNPSKAAQGGD